MFEGERISTTIRELNQTVENWRRHERCNSRLRDSLVSWKLLNSFLCQWSVTYIFSDENYFPDPFKYNPDRWSQENQGSIPKYAFLGFGEGPRICLGIRFALTQVKAGVASILSKYDVTAYSRTENPIEFSKTTFVLQPRNGIWLKFVKRNKWN